MGGEKETESQKKRKAPIKKQTPRNVEKGGQKRQEAAYHPQKQVFRGKGTGSA